MAVGQPMIDSRLILLAILIGLILLGVGYVRGWWDEERWFSDDPRED